MNTLHFTCWLSGRIRRESDGKFIHHHEIADMLNQQTDEIAALKWQRDALLAVTEQFVLLSQSLAVALTAEQTEECVRAFTNLCHDARITITIAKGS